MELSDRSEFRLGTRFLVFPQPPYIAGYENPEVIWLGPIPGGVLPGPADDRMYVIQPFDDKRPYRFPDKPPYPGNARPPAEPGPDGHFDHIMPMTDTFLAAHAYACARRALDVCEGYLGRRITWHFQPWVERLEIVPHISNWDNAQSGFGFLELGEADPEDGRSSFAYNFDSVAHEVGHLVLLAELDVPSSPSAGDFFAYHESVADFVSLLGLLHFDTALDRILRRTQGDLLIHNELDRFAELSDEKQLRVLNNSLRLEDVSGEVHDRSKPFSAALFDCLVETYQSLLFERGLSDIDPRNFSDLRRQMSSPELERRTRPSTNGYEIRHLASKAALQEARDLVGQSLVRSWRYLDPENFSFGKAALAFLQAADRDRSMSYVTQFEDCMRWRHVI